MQNKGSGKNVRLAPPVQKLTAEQEAEQLKASELKFDMDNQAQFFELRQRYALAMLSTGHGDDASDLFSEAHELASLDMTARCKESAALLATHNIVMRQPAFIPIINGGK